MDRWRQGGSAADGRSEGAHAHIHLARIAERGMSGLAQLLVQGGVVVTGSGPSPGPSIDRLRRLGVRLHVHSGQPTRPCPRSARWLVCGAEVGRTDPERLSALRRRLALRTPAACLAGLLRRRSAISVAGGRAASVAAAMIAWTMTRAGLDPTVVLGTPAPQLGGWARLGRGPHVVVEAVRGNEGDDWGALAPRVAVLLDLDREASGGGRIEALRAIATSVPRDGVVLALAGGAFEFEAEALRGQGVAVDWLALERGADWWGADLREDRGRFRFRAFRRDRFVAEVRLRVPGRRNVLSALSAVAACSRLDVPAPEVQLALEEFTGISGDFESRGSYRGVTLVDDAGDDPASVDEALRLGRRVFGDRRIWAVLLTNGAALVPEARDRYTAALAMADEVVIAGRGTALAEALAAAGRRARCVASLDDAILELDRHLEPGDVLVTLGAGDVGTISDAFIRRLPRDRPGR